jgi:hypothetical protein
MAKSEAHGAELNDNQKRGTRAKTDEESYNESADACVDATAADEKAVESDEAFAFGSDE